MTDYYRVKVERDDNPMNPREDWDNVGTMLCWHRRHILGDMCKKKNDPKLEMWRESIECTMLEMISRFDDKFDDRLSQWYDREYDRRGIAKAACTGQAYEKAMTELALERRELIRRKVDKFYVVLPLYIYDHSGVTMSTSTFSCPWDSGWVGFIYVSYAEAEKQYGYPEMKLPRHSPEKYQRIVEALKSEVETYDQFLTGEVYGFTVEKLNYEFEKPVGDVDADDNDLPWEQSDSCWGFFGDDAEESGMCEHVDKFLWPAMKEAQDDVDTWVLCKHEPDVAETPVITEA